MHVIYVIIAVDPLISKLAKRNSAVPEEQQTEETMVSAFVDDWSTTSSPDDLRVVRGILSDFEKASGKQINSDTSALVPSCRLTTAQEKGILGSLGVKTESFSF